jgi:hypothetical protein
MPPSVALAVYETVMAQLGQRLNYLQMLVDQLTGARDEYRARAERLAVELDRHRTEAQHKVAESDMRLRALQGRLDAAWKHRSTSGSNELPSADPRRLSPARQVDCRDRS